ncbi:O-methyltransferase [Propionibacteriaceae bacterium Y1685]|uniref:O-methyltransferase n=1 Tax=Microlunatus sp. Y1700 TaxID=3418487 RepID=UPI003B773824
MNASNPPKSAAKSAPKPASWAWAENLLPEAEEAASARAAAEPLGVSPLSRGTASTLTFLARTVNARAVVEIGTGSGVSGLALFQGMQDDGILTSVDIEPDHQSAARTVFADHGIRTQRFRLIAGAALTVLPKLSDGAYDLVFIDADKIEYPAYVDQAIRLLRHGGLLVMDNALWHDRVADDSNDDDDTAAIREAIAIVTENEDFTATLLPVGDGLLVAVKR